MVAIPSTDSNKYERISYDAYGTGRHHWRTDISGTGYPTNDDWNTVREDEGSYGVGDFNRSGVVDSHDESLIQSDIQGAIIETQMGDITFGGTDNIIGYAGYVFNAEHVTGLTPGLYTVRHRHYEPGGGLGDAAGGLGRWLSRDPIGYVDGMNLYEYVRANPVRLQDMSGLIAMPRDILKPIRPIEHAIDRAIARASRALDSIFGRSNRCIRELCLEECDDWEISTQYFDLRKFIPVGPLDLLPIPLPPGTDGLITGGVTTDWCFCQWQSCAYYTRTCSASAVEKGCIDGPDGMLPVNHKRNRSVSQCRQRGSRGSRIWRAVGKSITDRNCREVCHDKGQPSRKRHREPTGVPRGGANIHDL